MSHPLRRWQPLLRSSPAESVIGLGLHIVEAGEGAQWPEVVPNVVDGPFFDFAFFLRLSHVAGNRGDVEGAQKLQALLIEAHQGALMFNNRGEHVIVDQLFGCALEKAKRPEQNAVERLLALRVGKFEIQHAAVTFDHRQAGEFAGGIAIRFPVALEQLS